MPAPRHPRPRRPTGFTLIELIVVVVVLGILAAIAGIPAVSDAEQALDLAEIQVRDAVEMAQARAVATRVPHGVVFDTVSERFAIVDQAGQAVADPLTHADYVVRFDHPGQPADLDLEQASFGAAGPAAIFDGQGVPLTGGSLTLRCRGHARTLLLDAATGFLGTP